MAVVPFSLNSLTTGINAPAVHMTPNPAASVAPSQPSGNGYFWKGADGNVYVQGSHGINSAGVWDGNTANYWGSRGFAHTPDSPGGGQSNPNPNNNISYGSVNTGGGGGAVAPATIYPDKSNDIAVNQAGLDSTDSTRDAAIGKINDALGKIVGNYEGDQTTATNEYTTNSNSNQTDLQANKQTSLHNAVQGRQGLYSTLASLGALNGTGIDRANDAVREGANQDLTQAADTFATNQRGLDTSYHTYMTNEQRLEQKAKDAAANDTTQAQNDYYKNRQTYLKNMGDAYQAEGKTGQAKSFYDQVSSLFPQIASTNVPTIDLGYTGSAYSAPTLSQYVGKANNTTVQATPGQQMGQFNIPGLVAVNKKQPAV